MSLELKKFIKNSSIIAGVMLVCTLITQFVAQKYFVPINYVTVVIVWLITVGVFFFTKKSITSKTHGTFMSIFTAATVAKMFVLLIYIMIYIIWIRENNISFLVFLLSNYTVFTIYETYSILKGQKGSQS